MADRPRTALLLARYRGYFASRHQLAPKPGLRARRTYRNKQSAYIGTWRPHRLLLDLRDIGWAQLTSYGLIQAIV